MTMSAHRVVPVYRSAFERWEKRAGVRVKPRREMAADEPSDTYFPPELVPAAGHPLVVARGPAAPKRILTSRLFQYLHFTTELEATAVIPVTIDISLGRSGLHLPVRMLRDAFCITTDEAWHAQFSNDLMEQVSEHTGVPIALPARPQFIDRLAKVRHDLDGEIRGSASIAFSVVSETLISAILSDLPKDPRLPRVVRSVVADHAEDEGRHHAYFHCLLGEFWTALSTAQRRELGPVFPDLIRIFLEPDYRAVSYALFELGLTDDEVAEVMHDSYPAESVTRDIAAAAGATVRYLGDVGALDDPKTLDAFHRAGLV
ncbi:diiron oxygenase [Paractinoplanes ferrugineus]|nr:diiron oxygenase [Actinoplanes ferrugineus]